MKILIIGAGAIGGYLGAHLTVVGHEVAYVARPQTAERIASSGLSLYDQISITTHGTERHIYVHPKAYGSLDEALEATDYALVIATVKMYDLPAVLEELEGRLPQRAALITPQNGLGAEERAAAIFGPERIIAASITTPVSYRPQGGLQVERNGGIVFAPVAPNVSIDLWLDMFYGTHLNIGVTGDYRALKWSKLLFNLMGNATSAILDMPPAKIYRDRQLFQLEMRMLREALDVMDALALRPVDLPGAPTERLMFALRRLPGPLRQPLLARAMSRGRGSKMPSFHVDLAQGRKQSEVLAHNGMVAAIGQQQGVRAPVNLALATTLMRIVRGQLSRQAFAERPERLLDLINSMESQDERAVTAHANGADRPHDVREGLHQRGGGQPVRASLREADPDNTLGLAQGVSAAGAAADRQLGGEAS